MMPTTTTCARMPPEELRALTRSVVIRVTLSIDGIDITLGLTQLANALGASIDAGNEARPEIVLSIAPELRRAGQGKRLVIGEPYMSV